MKAYLPAPELIKRFYGDSMPDKNNQWLAIARKRKFFPGYYHAEHNVWMDNVEAFESFYRFCETQRAKNAILRESDDLLYYINQIRYGSEHDELEALDFNSPFKLQELGILFKLNAVTGIIITNGCNKHRKKVFASSYREMINFRSQVIQTYKSDFDAIGENQRNRGKKKNK